MASKSQVVKKGNVTVRRGVFVPTVSDSGVTPGDSARAPARDGTQVVRLTNEKDRVPVLDGEPAAEWVRIETLKVWRKNPDPPEASDVRDIARSIRRFGFAEPLLARKENGEIIAGHARYLAAKRLRLETVPVRWMDLPEGEAHMLSLADNKLAANRKRRWSGKEMSVLLDDLEEDGVDLTLGTGFHDDDIDKLLGEATEDGDLESSDDDESDSATKGTMGGLEYRVIVDCKDEAQQSELVQRLEGEGLSCRPLMS